MSKINLTELSTEATNPLTSQIDELTTLEVVNLINSEDTKVALSIKDHLPIIAKVIDIIVEAFRKGGRLIYIGAGTSGRLGVLDASECPPTYGVDSNMVVGIIAGGDTALRNAVEGAEDSSELGEQDLIKIKLSHNDVVVGLAASGRTPYVIGALNYAKKIGAKTVAISCSKDAKIGQVADYAILPLVGPEVITGSSRMKSGTAQKMVLNMLSTGAMIKIGKVFGNLMVDVKASNLKLIERQKRIVMLATQCSYEEAESILVLAENNCKLAIFMMLSNLNIEQAKAQLNQEGGHIRKALHSR